MQDDTQQPQTPNTEPTTTPPDNSSPFNPTPNPITPVDSTPIPSVATTASNPEASPFGAPATPAPAAAPNSTLGSQPTDQPPVSPTPGPIAPAPKTKKKLIIILLVALVLLIAAATVAYFLLMPKTNSNAADNTAQSADQISIIQKSAITATKINEFADVCDGKRVSNAPALATPNKTVPFVSSDDKWALFLYSLAETDRLTTNIEEASVVACALPNKTTTTVAKECKVTNFTTKEEYDIQYTGVTYDLTFYAAQSGEKISSEKLVATNDKCPPYATKAGIVYAIPQEDVASPAFDAFFAAN
jgi:hypothetical protein